MRPVAAAVGSGSLTSLAIAVARELLWVDSSQGISVPSPSLPDYPPFRELVASEWRLDILAVPGHSGGAQLGASPGSAALPPHLLDSLCPSGAEGWCNKAVVPGTWMSGLEERLLSEVEALRRGLESLTLQVEGIEARLKEVEERGSASGYTVVSTRLSSAAPAAVFAAPPTALRSSPVVAPVQPGDTEGRRLLAEEIGQFLRRSVSGQPRGTSGRDRLSLQNRCYVVVADFAGVLQQPPRFYSAFAPVRDQCKRGSDCGSSSFVGFATKWEARVALRAGGFALPPELENE